MLLNHGLGGYGSSVEEAKADSLKVLKKQKEMNYKRKGKVYS